MTTDFLNASNNSGWLFFYANYFLNASNFAVVVISKSNNSHPNAYTDYVILQLFELISVEHDSHTHTHARRCLWIQSITFQLMLIMCSLITQQNCWPLHKKIVFHWKTKPKNIQPNIRRWHWQEFFAWRVRTFIRTCV